MASKLVIETCQDLFLSTQLVGGDTDQITGLVHKSYFLRDLGRRAYEVTRYNATTSIALMRIVGIENSPEDLGLYVELLGNIGKLIDENFRLNDLACWFGPTEFAIQMPYVEESSAEKALQRISQMIDEVVKPFGAKIEFKVSQIDDSYTADVMVKILQQLGNFSAPSEELSIVY